MSLGGGPLDDAWGKQRRDSFATKPKPTGQHAWRDTSRSSGACSTA